MAHEPRPSQGRIVLTIEPCNPPFLGWHIERYVAAPRRLALLDSPGIRESSSIRASRTSSGGWVINLAYRPLVLCIGFAEFLLLSLAWRWYNRYLLRARFNGFERARIGEFKR